MTSSGDRADVLVDTSVAVAVVLAGHDAHERTVDALQGRLLGLAGHAWFETFSVLTRLPPPARRGPSDVAVILAHDFPASRFLDEPTTARLISRLPDLGVSGGAVYDALVGAAALHHGLTLVSRDHRAADLYRRLGVDAELLH